MTVSVADPLLFYSFDSKQHLQNTKSQRIIPLLKDENVIVRLVDVLTLLLCTISMFFIIGLMFLNLFV